jgi:hypothetical protein
MKRMLLLLLLLVYGATVHAQFNYSFTNARTLTTTYTDISSLGGAPIAMTNPETGASAAPINIGFDFNFNGTVFNQCMIHADGILRFGTTAPGSHTSLFANNNTTSTTVYTTTNANYQNVVFALFLDLVQGNQAPVYHVLTTGIAPNRVTTIQWKNLKDANSSGPILQSQFDNLEFQVKLFETSNNIQIIYGNFVSSANAVIGRAAQAGIKANSTNFIGAKRGNSLNLFEYTEFLDLPGHTIYNAGYGIRNNVLPPNGFSLVFNGQLNTDVSIAEVYADRSIIKTNAATASVRVKNEGRTSVSSIDVVLEITGANVFTQTINIPSLAAGADQVIDFSGYALPNIGNQMVKFTIVTAGDENSANNSNFRPQQVTNNFVQLMADAENHNAGVGFNGTAGAEMAVKMYGSGTRNITQIRMPFSSYSLSINLRILDDDGVGNSPGTVLLTTANRSTNADNEVVYNFTTPVSVTGNYYVVVKQNGTGNMAWQFAFQYPTQTNRVYTGNGFTFSPQLSDRGFLPLIKVIEQNNLPDVGVVAVVNPVCTYSPTTPVSVAVVNNATVVHDFAIDPVTVSGTVTNQKTNVVVPFSVVQNTGTLAAGQLLTVPVGIDYDMSDRATHKFVVSTEMTNDAAPENDTLSYVIANNFRLTKSFTAPVCPFTPVTLTATAGIYTNIQWDVNGSVSTGETLTFSPKATTLVNVTATDYRGCTITDVIEVPVKQTGLPPTPVIAVADTVLSYRNGFKNTFSTTSLADHSINWIGSGQPINGGLSYVVNGFRGESPETHTLYYKNITENCGSSAATITTRFGDGILMNNNNNETITDTSFYDSGGALGANFGADHFTKTFYPQVAGNKLKLAIYNISLGQFSTMEIYDGTNASAPRIGRLDRFSANALSEYMASNADGALTIYFRANGNTSLGWLAGITSEKPLQYRSVQNGLFADAGTWESKLPNAVTYSAATRQPFKGDDIIEIMHTVTLPANLTIPLDQTVVETTGTLVVPAATSLNLYTDLPGYELTIKGTLTVNGNVYGGQNPSVDGRVALSGTLNLSGSIQTDSLVVVTSALPATINTSGNAEISRLKINNAAGLNLNGNLNISRVLDLKNGIIHISNSNYIKLVSGYGPVINNGSAASYINGKLRQQKFSTTDSIAFPVGKPGIYRKITLLANQTSYDDYVEYEAELLATAPVSRTLPATLSNVNQQWYHHLTIIGGSNYFTDATATIDYVAADGITDPATLHLAKDDGSTNWIDLEGTAIGATSGNITSNTFSELGDFVLGNVSSTLPVNLISFKAKLINNTVQLNWQVANESNFKGYEIERSTDGSNFQQVGWEVATGGNGLINYHHHNVLTSAGVYYYRLKMVDHDGAFKYSSLVSVNCKSIVSNHVIRVMPNPFVDQVSVQYQAIKAGTLELQLIDITGRQLKRNQYALNAGANECVFVTGDLPKAVYLLKIISDEGVWIEKIFKK